MSKKLGVGFVGSGFNTRFHILGWNGVRDADVLGVWSPNEKNAASAAKLARDTGVGAAKAYRLAGIALLGIGFSARYTSRTVWAASPCPIETNRFKRGLAVVFWVTVPTAFSFLLFGGLLAHHQGGWPAVANRVFNWKILAAFGCYLLWALMQQTLLEFYFLGRLLVLFPKKYFFLPMILTGCCFGLVHLPDLWTASVTVVAGMVWSVIYYRYRLLLPLAVSHAALGTSFYYGIMGHDLAAEWKGLFH